LANSWTTTNSTGTYSKQALPAVCKAMAQCHTPKYIHSRQSDSGIKELADSKEARKAALGSEERVFLKGLAVTKANP